VVPGGQYLGQENEGVDAWPLVLHDDRRRGLSKPLLGVLAAVLLLAAAAGLYVGNRYFGAGRDVAGSTEIKPLTSTPPPARAGAGTDRPVQAANSSAATQSEGRRPASEAVSGPNQTHPEQPAQAAQPAAQQPVPVTSPAANVAGGAKLVSFQIASVPNEAAAKEFCDRLIRAGVPAYTVRADIPGRGRWFRVRAGKFGSAQESQQSAVVWRKLAAAAGINLQLVQCDYEP
jgi:cell division septation protein DedD